jgi:hypothetical protein
MSVNVSRELSGNPPLNCVYHVKPKSHIVQHAIHSNQLPTNAQNAPTVSTDCQVSTGRVAFADNFIFRIQRKCVNFVTITKSVKYAKHQIHVKNVTQLSNGS